MKFWNDMAQKQSLQDTDILMVGDPTDTTHPKHSTLSTLISWVKSKLGIATITPGNLPVAASDGTLADSGQRPVKICDSYGNPRAATVIAANQNNRVVNKVVIDCINPETNDYFHCDTGDVLRVWFPYIVDTDGKWDNDGTTTIAKKYQDYQVFIRFFDTQKNEIVIRGLSAQNAQNYYRNMLVHDVYGAMFDIQLGRRTGTTDTQLYAIVLGSPKNSEIATAATPAPTETITLAVNSEDYPESYTVIAATAEVVQLVANTTGCSVTLPTTLTADKAVTFIIPTNSKSVDINGTTYDSEQTVFCIYHYDSDTSTGTWAVNSTATENLTDIADYSHAEVVAGCNIPVNSTYIVDTAWPTVANLSVGDLVLLAGQSTKSEIGIYKVVGKSFMFVSFNVEIGLSIMQKVADAENIITVRVKNKYNTSDMESGMYVNEYDSENESSIKFEKIADKADLVSGKVPAAQLPSYVDDVIEGYYSSSVFYSDQALTTAITGETGKIYVDLSTNYTYRYTGSIYVRIDQVDVATTTSSGLLSAADKTKLDALDNANVVHLTGEENVTGIKTFTSAINANGGINAAGNVALNVGADAAGDMYYRNSSGLLSRLAKGADGQVLGLSAGIPAWQTASSSISGSLSYVSALLGGDISQTNSQTTLTIQDSGGLPKVSIESNTIIVEEAGYYMLSLYIYLNGSSIAGGGFYLGLYNSLNVGFSSFSVYPISLNTYFCYLPDYVYLPAGTYHIQHSCSTGTATFYNSKLFILNPRHSASASATSTRNYLTAYMAAATVVSVGNSYSKLSLLQATWEDGTNMLTSNYSLTDNRIVCATAGKKRVTVNISIIGSSSEVGVTVALRKYNTSKYTNYRVEAEPVEYTKDTFGCNIHFSKDIQIATDEAGVTGLEIAIKAISSTTVTVKYCNVNVEDLAN